MVVAVVALPPSGLGLGRFQALGTTMTYQGFNVILPTAVPKGGRNARVPQKKKFSLRSSTIHTGRTEF